MQELSISHLLLFSAFVVPGAVPLQIYRLKVPSVEQSLKDNILEDMVFGIANFSILYFPIIYVISEGGMRSNPVASYVILMICFFSAPILWPFMLFNFIKLLEKARLIRARAKTSWDSYFGRLQRGCFIIVHMNDGTYVGGKFDVLSYASSYPNPGHLFIEELWEVDQDGVFTGKIFVGEGVILRPTDYKYLRVST